MRLFIGILLLMALAGLTYRRNTVWRSEVSLFENTVAESPMKPRPRVNLGWAYQREGRYAEAGSQFYAAMALSMREDVSAFDRTRARQFTGMNILAFLMQTRQWDAAEQQAVTLWNEFPGFPPSAMALSAMALMRNDPKFAVAVLDRSIAQLAVYGWYASPGDLWRNRGAAYELLKDCRRANEDYAEARSRAIDTSQFTCKE